MTKWKCTNGHDRCFGGVSAGAECPYCERQPDRASDGRPMVVFWLLVALCIAMFVVAIARAQGPHTGHPGPGEPDPYIGIMDGNGRSCCGRHDCQPIGPGEAQFAPDLDRWQVRTPDGRWLDVDPTGLVRDQSPDAQMHACWKWDRPEGGAALVVVGVRCLILPMLF
jgi:hypothetical protein